MNRLSSYILLGTLCLVSCAKEQPVCCDEGGLLLKLSAASSVTRSTPSDLGVPSQSEFNVVIVNSKGMKVYEGGLPDGVYHCPEGTYSVSASCGSNPLIATDSPYYVGEAQASVSGSEVTSVTVPCKVGNALISATFGADEAETARFGRYYSEYSLSVELPDGHRMDITNYAPHKSVYLRAGQSVSLSFRGTRSSDGQKVTLPVPLPSGVSSTLGAADHLKVFLSLAPASDGALINAETLVETVDIAYTISYEYLPAPTVAVAHTYDVSGNLTGTDLSLSALYGDWSAKIKNEKGDIVRNLSGSGALSSPGSEQQVWPFLPAGTYTASFSIRTEDGSVYDMSKTRTFTVPEPEVSIRLTGYTSYNKYLEGAVDAANACDRLTTYDLSARVNIAPALLISETYSASFSCAYLGVNHQSSLGENSIVLPNETNTSVSMDPHPFTATLDFAGQRLTAEKGLRITGLPIRFNPPREGDWSSSHESATHYKDGYVQLGNESVYESVVITNSDAVRIPSGVKVGLDYAIFMHSGSHGTTFSVSLESQKIFSQTRDHQDWSSEKNGKDYSGSVRATTTENVSRIKCENSYGVSWNYSRIKDLYFYYGK